MLARISAARFSQGRKVLWWGFAVQETGVRGYGRIGTF